MQNLYYFYKRFTLFRYLCFSYGLYRLWLWLQATLRVFKWHDQTKYLPLPRKIGSNLKKHKDPLRLWLCTRTEKLIKCQRKTLSSFQSSSRIPRGKSHVCRNNNKRWIIPPWRKISVKSVFIAEPWTNSNLIRGANLFRSQKCIGFNFTLHAFRYQQEGVKREGMRRETKRKTENIWSLIFCQKSPYQRELKSILLQTKEGARGK